jgi:RNA polymerase subunit RPABC4/transcription elongation factor Spt4
MDGTSIFIIAAHLLLAVIFAIVGEYRKIGGTWLFLISLLLSPIVALIVFLVSPTLPEDKTEEILGDVYACVNCKFEYHHNAEFCPVCSMDDNGWKEEDYKENLTDQELELLLKEYKRYRNIPRFKCSSCSIISLKQYLFCPSCSKDSKGNTKEFYLQNLQA